MTYSSIPGTSRHHWGTDIDIIDQSVQLPEEVYSLGKTLPWCWSVSNLKIWMERYGSDFGFELVYTDDTTREGFFMNLGITLTLPHLRIFLASR